MDISYDTKNPYGTCTCGAPLVPVWFRERETKVVHGHMTYTGRTRRACSHLECTICLREHCIDDSFDGPWEG